MIRGFPQEAVLRDGKRVLIRPFTQNDTQALWDFFQTLPADLRRFAWDNISDRALIERWGAEVDYAKALPLLAQIGHLGQADDLGAVTMGLADQRTRYLDMNRMLLNSTNCAYSRKMRGTAVLPY